MFDFEKDSFYNVCLGRVYLTLCLNTPRAGGMVKDGQSTKKGHWEISPQKLSFTENGLIETDVLNRFYCLFVLKNKAI